MFQFKRKIKKYAGSAAALAGVLGAAFYLGCSAAPNGVKAFSASDFASDDDPSFDIPVDIFNPTATTTLADAISIITEETTLRDSIIIFTDETTLPDAIITVGSEETSASETEVTPDVSETSESDTSAAADPPTLILTYYTFNLTVGQEDQIYWKVENSIINNYIETFSSDNPDVASVSESGVITARAAGTANITVTWGDLSAVAVVNVSAAPVTTVPPVTLPPATEPTAEVSTEVSADTSDTVSEEAAPKVRLDGCLYNTKGEAVDSIMLTAGGKTAITDLNGYFVFNGLNIGDNVITVGGNESLACTVSLASDTTLFLLYNGETIESCSSYEEMAVRFVITKVEFEASDRHIRVGETVVPYYQYEPRDASVTQTLFASSNEKVARIDQNGVISAISEGETVISVILNDGQAQAEFTLTVNPEETGKYSGLIAAGETLVILILAGAAFVVYKRYKRRMAQESGEEEDDE